MDALLIVGFVVLIALGVRQWERGRTQPRDRW
jgi:hypothetical protein